MTPQPQNNSETLSAKVAERGIKTARDFVDFMSALMADVVSDRVAPQKAQAACQAADKMLRVVEMQHRFAPAGGAALELVPESKAKMLEGGK